MKLRYRNITEAGEPKLFELTAAITDEIGRVWPKGTMFRPLAGGLRDGAPYRDVAIIPGATPVTFREVEA